MGGGKASQGSRSPLYVGNGDTGPSDSMSRVPSAGLNGSGGLSCWPGLMAPVEVMFR
ncbi:hypothetical protein DFAR_2690030 [Desulfarculales bacterium]